MATTVVVAVSAALVIMGGLPVLLRSVPEPESAVEDHKVPYAMLASPAFCGAVAAFAAAGVVLVRQTVPAPLQPLWCVVVTLGTILAGVDWATTWIPARWNNIGIGLTAVLVFAGFCLGVSSDKLVTAVLGGCAALGIYWLIWIAARGGMGFGDVRFAILVGIPVASLGWPSFVLALLATPLIALVPALIARVRGRKHIPFAPAILAGAYVAAAVASRT